MTSHQKLSRICGESYQESSFEEANIEVLVQGNVFAFRGTDEPKDAIRDIRILPLWTRDHKSIELTGHSLGGAVALIVGALMVRDEIPPKQIVTFGAPRCGRLKILDTVPVTQYRHGKDIVPVLGMCRRHNKLVEFGERESAIKDHYMLNYVKMKKLPEVTCPPNS